MACKRSGVRAPLAPPETPVVSASLAANGSPDIPQQDEFQGVCSPNGVKNAPGGSMGIDESL